jgi:3-hydroxyisobutyrate dehydrogenase
MVGAAEGRLEKWSAFLSHFGPNPVRVGPVGAAAALKLALNNLIASHIAGFALSLGIVRRRGIDVEHFMTILRQSALFAPTFDRKLPLLLSRDYASARNFPASLLLKDIDLILAEAERAGLAATALQGVRHLLTRVVDDGRGDEDYAVISEAVDPGR